MKLNKLFFPAVIIALLLAFAFQGQAQTQDSQSLSAMTMTAEQQVANADFAIVNAASQMGYTASANRVIIVRDSLVTIYGQNLTDRVYLTDISGSTSKCKVTFWSPNQVNAQIPAHVGLGNGTILNVRDNGTSQTANVDVWNTLGGTFTMTGNGVGIPSAYLLRFTAASPHATAEMITAFDEHMRQWQCMPIEFSNNPTERVFVALYGTGYRNRANIGNVTIHALGKVYAPSYANRALLWEGVDQINVEIPKSDFAGRGEVEFEVRVNGTHSNRVRMMFK